AAPRPSAGFDLMHDSGLMKHILPELAALKGIEQDKQPGDDVYGHTMRALDAARSDREIESAGDPDLLFAILLHDVGKARTARYHPPSKRVVFFGHQLVSARLARRWMERMKLSSAGLHPERISALIEHHMFETKASYTDRAIRRFVAKVGVDLIFSLLDLRLADNRGGKHPHGIKGAVRLRHKIREEIAKKPPFGPRDLAVNGSDLMAMGLAEGPMIGVILGELVESVLDEPEKNTRDELLALAREMMKNPEIAARAEAARRVGGRKRREEETSGGDSDGEG
ncbi:MAG TPA: HD domain-containing protein, partial [bacterium]|nr:HD domain-containing protein [bacterium]